LEFSNKIRTVASFPQFLLKIPYRHRHSDRHENLAVCCQSHIPPVQRISAKFEDKVLSYRADRQIGKCKNTTFIRGAKDARRLVQIMHSLANCSLLRQFQPLFSLNGITLRIKPFSSLFSAAFLLITSSSSSSDRVDSRGPLRQPRVTTTTSLGPFGTNAEGFTVADLLDP